MSSKLEMQIKEIEKGLKQSEVKRDNLKESLLKYIT